VTFTSKALLTRPDCSVSFSLTVLKTASNARCSWLVSCV
jgi:hypothetical protein